MISLPERKAFLDLFPAPEFLLMSTAGISITDHDTKFVQLQRRFFEDGFRPIHLGKSDNPKGAVESGLITNSEGLAPVLREIASNYGIHYAHATLPEEKAYLFTTTIASVPPKGLRDAVAFIIEENVPISLVESVFDFEIIKENQSAEEIKLAVSVLSKNLVNNYIETLESAGITPISFDLESQAIARAVIHSGDKRSHLIINLSVAKTGFYVVEGEVVQFSTTLTYGIGNDDSYSSIGDLKIEMRKVFAFWNERADLNKSENRIEKIIICGLGANKKDFIEKLMEEVEVKYELADVWLNLSPSRNYASKIPFDESLDYASVIGSALFHN